MRWFYQPVAAVILAGVALTSVPQPVEAKPERPEYAVVSTEKEFEIRDYSTMVLAEFSSSKRDRS